MHLVWSNFLITDGCCCTTYDEDTRYAVSSLVDWPGMAHVAGVFRSGDNFVVSRTRLLEAEQVEGPILLASANEPSNWGMWLLYTLPAILHFIDNRSCYHKLLVCADHPNMVAMLHLLGLSDADYIPHDVTKAYYCRDLYVFRQACQEFYVSLAQRESCARLRTIASAASREPRHRRIYVGRRRRSVELGAVRPLLNEGALIEAVQRLGFAQVDPEFLTPLEQVATFAGARQIIALGGAGLFNNVFCESRTEVVDIESSAYFLPSHSTLLASCGLDYGLIVGQIDHSDPAIWDKRWTVDVAEAVRAVQRFMS